MIYRMWPYIRLLGTVGAGEFKEVGSFALDTVRKQG